MKEGVRRHNCRRKERKRMTQQEGESEEVDFLHFVNSFDVHVKTGRMRAA